MNVDKSLLRIKKHLERAILKGLEANPQGGNFYIKGNDKNRKLIIEVANELPGVAAEEVNSQDMFGKIVKLSVEPLPSIEISYDDEKTWVKF